jgi:hypothetical protein
MDTEKILAEINNKLDSLLEMNGKLDRILEAQRRVMDSNLKTEFDRLRAIKDFIKEKEYCTRSDLYDRFGFITNYMLYKKLDKNIQYEKDFLIFKREGTLETLFAYKGKNTNTSKAIIHFNGLKKGEYSNLGKIMHEFKVDEDDAIEIYNLIRKIFHKRVKYGTGLPYHFERKA